MLGSYETFKTEYLKLSNIDLGLYKESQMKRRIDNFVKKYKAQSYEEFLALLKKDPKAYESFVTYLTINVSEFFRNPLQWKTLEEKILPMLLEQRRGPLKVWSAACSTGDEPYSLAMLFSKYLPLKDIQILATDLDLEVLEKARVGIYSERSIKDMPADCRKKYVDDQGNGIVKISDSLKSCIKFQQHNLLRDPYPKDMDLIVCRNVMIYFTEEAKDQMYYQFSESLRKDGVLFVGSTEQIIGSAQYNLKSLQAFFYQKN